MIRNHRYYLSAARLLKSSIILEEEEHRKVLAHMKTFDFIRHRIYEYDDETIYIGIWTDYDALRKEYPSDADFIVMYYS